MATAMTAQDALSTVANAAAVSLLQKYGVPYIFGMDQNAYQALLQKETQQNAANLKPITQDQMQAQITAIVQAYDKQHGLSGLGELGSFLGSIAHFFRNVVHAITKVVATLAPIAGSILAMVPGVGTLVGGAVSAAGKAAQLVQMQRAKSAASKLGTPMATNPGDSATTVQIRAALQPELVDPIVQWAQTTWMSKGNTLPDQASQDWFNTSAIAAKREVRAGTKNAGAAKDIAYATMEALYPTLVHDNDRNVPWGGYVKIGSPVVDLVLTAPSNVTSQPDPTVSVPDATAGATGMSSTAAVATGAAVPAVATGGAVPAVATGAVSPATSTPINPAMIGLPPVSPVASVTGTPSLMYPAFDPTQFFGSQLAQQMTPQNYQSTSDTSQVPVAPTPTDTTTQSGGLMKLLPWAIGGLLLLKLV